MLHAIEDDNSFSDRSMGEDNEGNEAAAAVASYLRDSAHDSSLMPGDEDWVDGSTELLLAGVLVVPPEDYRPVEEQEFSTLASSVAGAGTRSYSSTSRIQHSQELSLPESLASDVGSLQDIVTQASATSSKPNEARNSPSATNPEQDSKKDSSLYRSLLFPSLVALLLLSLTGNIYFLRHRTNVQQVSVVTKTGSEPMPERDIEWEKVVREENQPNLDSRLLTWKKDENDENQVVMDNCWAQVKLGSCAASSKKQMEEGAQRLSDMFWQTEHRIRERANDFFAEAQSVAEAGDDEKEDDDAKKENQNWGNSFWEMRAKFRERASEYFSEPEAVKQDLKEEIQRWGTMLKDTVDHVQSKANDLFVQTKKAIADAEEESQRWEEELIKSTETISHRVNAFIENLVATTDDDNETVTKKNSTSTFDRIFQSRGLRQAATVFVSGVMFASVATLLNSLVSDAEDE